MDKKKIKNLDYFVVCRDTYDSNTFRCSVMNTWSKERIIRKTNLTKLEAMLELQSIIDAAIELEKVVNEI